MLQLQFGRLRRMARMQCNVVTSDPKLPMQVQYKSCLWCIETATLNPSFRGTFHAVTNGPILSEYHTTDRKKQELDDTCLIVDYLTASVLKLRSVRE